MNDWKSARWSPCWIAGCDIMRCHGLPFRWFSIISRMGPWSMPITSVAYQGPIVRLKPSRQPYGPHSWGR